MYIFVKLLGTGLAELEVQVQAKALGTVRWQKQGTHIPHPVTWGEIDHYVSLA